MPAPTTPDMGESGGAGAGERANKEAGEERTTLDLRDIGKLTKACESSEEPQLAAAACFALGGVIGESDTEEAQVRMRALAIRGHKLLTKACNGEDAESCTLLGSIYAMRLQRLESDSPQAHKAAAVAITSFQRGCGGGEGFACTAAAMIYERGVGVTADVSRAKQLYGQGCALAHAGGCLRAAELIWQVNDPTDDVPRLRRARDAYARACEVGSLDGCEWAGYLFVGRLGGLEQDLKSALPHYQKACSGGRANACTRLGAIHDHHGERQRALAAFTRACKGGEAPACDRAAKLRESKQVDPGPF